MATIRRLYFYGVCLAAGLSVLGGLAGLLELLAAGLAGERSTMAGHDVFGITWRVALLVVATPIWGWHWWRAELAAAADEEERHSVWRRLYLAMVLYWAANEVVGALLSVTFQALARANGAPGQVGSSASTLSGAVAALAVWAGAWWYHARLAGGRRMVAYLGTPGRWYVYLVSASALAFGLVAVVNLARQATALAERGAPTLLFGPDLAALGLERVLAVAVIMLLAWLWHWRVLGQGDWRSTLRTVYFYVALFLGVSATIGITARLPYEALRRLFGSQPPPVQPDNLVELAAGALVAAWVWAYHWQVLQGESRLAVVERRGTLRAFYGYLVTLAALSALVSGLGGLLSELLDYLNGARPSISAGTSSFADNLAFYLTLTAVALPIWAWYWQQLQARAALPSERQRLSRRLYLAIVIFASLMGCVGVAIYLLYQLLNRLLDVGAPGTDMARNLGFLLIGLTFLLYHVRVLLVDLRQRADGAERAAGPTKETALLPPSPMPSPPSLDEQAAQWQALRGEAAALLWLARERGTTPVGLLRSYVAYLQRGGEPLGEWAPGGPEESGV